MLQVANKKKAKLGNRCRSESLSTIGGVELCLTLHVSATMRCRNTHTRERERRSFCLDGDRLAKGKTIDDDKEEERDDSSLYLPDSTTHVSLGTLPNNK